MNAFFAFTKKEWMENIRTYKLIIMGAVFLIFGMMNPIFAKLIPDILKIAMPEGMTINLPEPTAFDSWSQFFKNVGQMGLFVLVIVFCGTMASELGKGTLINILTKGMKRSTVILSKFTMATLIWAMSYLLCLGVSWGYTAYFWEMGGMHHIFWTFFGLWVFGEMLISLVILGGTMFKNIYGSLLLTGGVVVAMTVMAIFPSLKKYNPVILTGENLLLLQGKLELWDFLPAVIICSVLTVVYVVASLMIFNKKQL